MPFITRAFLDKSYQATDTLISQIFMKIGPFIHSFIYFLKNSTQLDSSIFVSLYMAYQGELTFVKKTCKR